MGARLSGNQAVMVGNQRSLRASRHVQYVKAVPMAQRQIECPTCGDDRGIVIANARVISHVGRAREPLGIGPYGRFIFAMGR